MPMRRTTTRRKSLRSSNDNTAGCLFIVIVILLIYSFGPCERNRNQTVKDLEALTEAQQKQIKVLQQSELELQKLIDLIEKETAGAQEVADELKADIERLRLVEQTEKDKVDAIFKEQEKRRQKSIWFEWAIAIIVGILSSIVAQFLWHRLWRRRTVLEDDATPADESSRS